MQYSRFIRWSHTLVAVTIIFQLMIALFMDHPHAAKPMTIDGGLYFRWHAWVGLAVLVLLTCGWIYRVINWQSEAGGRFFPWLTSSGRTTLMRDGAQFLRLRWTSIPTDGALVGTIHGLGLFIALAMALTGGALYVALGAQNTVTPFVNNLMDVHSFLSTFMWIYLCGHALMACWHQYMGHASFARIFKL